MFDKKDVLLEQNFNLVSSFSLEHVDKVLRSWDLPLGIHT